MDKLKVLIADNDVRFRKLLSEAVDKTNFGRVIHVASKGSIAIEWMEQCGVDVVILDTQILKFEGMNIIGEIRNKYPKIEIIISDSAKDHSPECTLEALKLGAIDFFLKPECRERLEGISNLLNTLFVQIKIKGFSKAVPESTSMRNKAEAAEVKSIMPSRTDVFSGCDLLAVASSTGGPHALEELLTKLPRDFPAPVLVIQHMPPDFTRVLADSLNKRCELDVAEGYESQAIERGKVIIAPGGFHMVVGEGDDSKKAIKLIGTPPVNGIRPSADVLFDSIAGAYKDKKILSVILTGMGNDGTKGIKEIKKLCRCYCITQSEKTCVVYGMPRTVFEAGLSDEAIDLPYIAERLVMISTGRRMR